MNLRFVFGMTLGVSGIIVACSGSSSSTTSSSGGSATDAAGFVSNFCGIFAPCCGQVGKPTDGAYCRAIYSALLTSQQYNAAKGSACLAELRGQSSSSTFCTNPTASAPSCDGAFKEGGGGTKQPGEACTADGDCASSPEGDVNCASSYANNTQTRSCQVEIDGKEGDAPCIYTRKGNTKTYTSTTSFGDAGPARPPARGYGCDVAKGVYCDSTSKACTKIQDVGGPCTYGNEACVETAFCNSGTKKCEPRIAVGASCATSSQGCVSGAACDTKTRLCTATLADGSPCTSSTQCASESCVNEACAKRGGSDFSLNFICGGG